MTCKEARNDCCEVRHLRQNEGQVGEAPEHDHLHQRQLAVPAEAELLEGEGGEQSGADAEEDGGDGD